MAPAPNQETMTDTEPAVDLAPLFTGAQETPLTEPQLSAEVDHVLVQVVTACYRDGRKVDEVAFQPVKLFHPFALDALLEQAEQQAEARWAERGGQ